MTRRDAAGGSLLRRDKTAAFVSWTEDTTYDPATETTKPGLIRGIYLGECDGKWLIRLPQGELKEVDQTKWDVCQK